MSTPYIGEIRLFSGNFAPVGWLLCQGQTLPISQYDVLFNLIGTTYGGDGQTTFALPDLRGRVPLHQGSNHVLGEQGGAESVTLTASHIPQHTHAFVATSKAGTQANPGGNLLANSQGPQPYIQENPDNNLSAQAMSLSGGSQPHENMQSFLCINFIIATEGIYPSPS